ncbi:hypothetical protein D3C87_1065550 [compost metagenome]
MVGKQGREHEQAPDAVDDRWHAGQQLDSRAQRAAQPGRADFREEQGDAEADGKGDQQGDDRRHQGANDGDQGAVLVIDGVPFRGHDEMQAEGLEGRYRFHDQRNDDADQDDQHRQGEQHRHLVEHEILEALLAHGGKHLRVTDGIGHGAAWHGDRGGGRLCAHSVPYGWYCRYCYFYRALLAGNACKGLRAVLANSLPRRAAGGPRMSGAYMVKLSNQ